MSGHARNMDQAEKTLERVLDVIGTSLACGEPVSIRNFGKFEPRTRSAVTRRNPVSGEEMKVPSRIGVGFVPSPSLKERINVHRIGHG